MRAFFDWLLGPDRVGWLKTALPSGFIGMAIAYLLDPTIFDASRPAPGKWYFIALGYPVQWAIRRWYQNRYMRPRESQWLAELAETRARLQAEWERQFGRWPTPDEWRQMFKAASGADQERQQRGD